ncbi:hypothetical protein PYCC9005_005017 [Savitreella phatthalungensis]
MASAVSGSTGLVDKSLSPTNGNSQRRPISSTFVKTPARDSVRGEDVFAFDQALDGVSSTAATLQFGEDLRPPSVTKVGGYKATVVHASRLDQHRLPPKPGNVLAPPFRRPSPSSGHPYSRPFLYQSNGRVGGMRDSVSSTSLSLRSRTPDLIQPDNPYERDHARATWATIYSASGPRRSNRALVNVWQDQDGETSTTHPAPQRTVSAADTTAAGRIYDAYNSTSSAGRPASRASAASGMTDVSLGDIEAELASMLQPTQPLPRIVQLPSSPPKPRTTTSSLPSTPAAQPRRATAHLRADSTDTRAVPLSLKVTREVQVTLSPFANDIGPSCSPTYATLPPPPAARTLQTPHLTSDRPPTDDAGGKMLTAPGRRGVLVLLLGLVCPVVWLCVGLGWFDRVIWGGEYVGGSAKGSVEVDIAAGDRELAKRKLRQVHTIKRLALVLGGLVWIAAGVGFIAGIALAIV